tara:strand:+ start:1566 stop:1844 length:279 start_codon:yes stop_codon:yes gene_type:complete
MEQTVTSILTAATDNVNVITEINGLSSIESTKVTQAQLNEIVKNHVEHLESVLRKTPKDEIDKTPDVAGSSVDKTSYTNAISVGKAYIASNS